MDKSLKKASLIGGGALLGALALFSLLSLYEKGYRFDGIRIAKPATVLLSHFPADAELHVGEQEVDQQPEGGEISLTLKASTQHLIVSKPGFWPWEKEIALPSGVATRFGVFLLREAPEGTPVPERDPLRRELEQLFSRATLPTREAPIVSDDGKASLFVEDGRIVTRWLAEEEAPQYYCIEDSCEEHAALSFDAELRDLAFLPGRNDVALLAIQNGIFALELDNRGTQNFQPAYRGTRPRFVLKEGMVYLKDGLAVLSLSL